MCHEHPLLFPQKFGQKRVHYTWQNTVSISSTQEPREQLRPHKTKLVFSPQILPLHCSLLRKWQSHPPKCSSPSLVGVTLHSHTLHKTRHQGTPGSALSPPTCVIPKATASAWTTRPLTALSRPCPNFKGSSGPFSTQPLELCFVAI